MEILIVNISTVFLIFTAWGFLFIVFAGIGNIVNRLWMREDRSIEHGLSSFWIGWAHAIFFLQLWHLFLPVDWRSTSLVSLVGVSGFFLGSKQNSRGHFYQVSDRKSFFVIILLGFWLACCSSLAYWNYDSGLYHLNTVKWISSFPIVPGLGNLHSRLAFNSSYFLYVSMLDVGFWKHKSAYLANGILLLVFFSQVFLAWLKIFLSKNPLKFYELFCAALILPAFLLADILVNVSSPSPDLPVIILVMLLYINFTEFLGSRALNQKERFYRFYVMAVYTALGITIKLNFLVFGIVILSIAGYSLWRDHPQGRSILIRIFSGFAAVISFWILRGIILSGYAIYPFPWGAVPVEWRIPHASVQNMMNWTYAWARTPKAEHWRDVLGNWNWVGGWLPHAMGNPYVLAFPLLLAAGCIILFLVYQFSGKGRSIKENVWLLILPALAAVIFWFFTAPDPRFGGIFAWMLAISSFTLVISFTKKAKELTVIFVLSFVLWQIAMDFGQSAAPGVLKDFKGNFIPILRKNSFLQAWNEIFTENLELRNAPRVPLIEYTTRSGLIIYVPEAGDQCWDAPLPCSVYPHPDLRLRKAGSLRHGFVVDPKREDDVSVGMHDSWRE